MPLFASELHRRVFLSALLFCLPASVGAQELYTHSGLVLIRHDPELLTLNSDLLNALVRNNSRMSAAVAEAFGEEASDSMSASVLFMVPSGASGEAGYYYLTVSSGVSPEAAAKLFRPLCGQLELALTELQKASQARIDERQAVARQLLKQRLQHTEEELNSLAEDYLKLRLQSLVSSKSLQGHLEAQLLKSHEYRMLLVGHEARRKALEREIDTLRQQAAEKTADDELIRELKSVLTIREKLLEGIQTLTAQGVKSIDQLYGAQEGVAQAKIALLRARRDAIDPATAERLAALNRELSQLVVESAEVQAFLNHAERQKVQLLDDLRKHLEVEGEMTRVQHQMELLQEQLARLTAAREELRDALFGNERVEVISLGT